MDRQEIEGAVEAVLFAGGDPVPVSALAQALDVTELELRPIIEAMIDRYRFERRGIQIIRVEDAVQMSTNAAYGDVVQAVLAPRRSRPLSQSALETLSVIAYRQPVTRREIEEIRGVSSDYSMEVLLKRGLIREAGTADRLGKPVLFATTDEFLRCFALESLLQLPPLTADAAFAALPDTPAEEDTEEEAEEETE